MSHRLQQKKSQTSLPTNLSNQPISNNLIKKDLITFEKQARLNSSITTDDPPHNKNNLSDLKDKERNH